LLGSDSRPVGGARINQDRIPTNHHRRLKALLGIRSSAKLGLLDFLA
jgi:hypothetical protein